MPLLGLQNLSDCDKMADLYTFENFEEETHLTWTVQPTVLIFLNLAQTFKAN